MSGVKSRVLAFIDYKGIKMKEFEAMADLSSGYVTSMRKGFGERKLNNVLIAFPELNRDWLLFGEGSMLKPTAVQQVEGNSGVATQVDGDLPPIRKIVGDEVTAVPEDAYMMVEYADLRASAGVFVGSFTARSRFSGHRCNGACCRSARGVAWCSVAGRKHS